MEDEKNEKGFVIKDRRLFDETGEIRGDEEKKGDDRAAAEQAPPSDPPPLETGGSGPDPDEDLYLPDATFANFVLSMSTTALFHFGDFPDPASNRSSRNLKAAKHTIDTLGMLRDKTAGNLADDEKNLLEGILFELRMRYVKESQGS